MTAGVAEDARSRLLAAAVAAFAARGFHGTTTRDIAAAAGMSPAALYVHHRSKEELLHQISRTGHEATLALVEEAVASSDDPVAQLARLVEDFVRHHAVAHTSARIVNYELAALSEPHLAEITELRHRIDAVVRDLVERGVAAGVFTTPDPRDDRLRPALAWGSTSPAGTATRAPGPPTTSPPTTASSPCGWSAAT